MNIILVENSQHLAERMTQQVNDIPGAHICGVAATPECAIELIEETQPDVVLLDIRLDGGTGWQVLEYVQQHKPTPTVIVLTNYPYPQYRKKYMEGGADYFFDKTVELPQAMQVVASLTPTQSEPSTQHTTYRH